MLSTSSHSSGRAREAPRSASTAVPCFPGPEVDGQSSGNEADAQGDADPVRGQDQDKDQQDLENRRDIEEKLNHHCSVRRTRKPGRIRIRESISVRPGGAVSSEAWRVLSKARSSGQVTRSCTVNEQRYGYAGFRSRCTRRPQLPAGTGCHAPGSLSLDLPHNAPDINNRVPGEDLGQPVRQAADKTAAGPFTEVKIEPQG
jgi:hypothetical protein